MEARWRKHLKLSGRTLPGLLFAAVATVCGYILEYSPYILILGFVALFTLMEFILWRGSERKWRSGALITLAAMVVLPTIAAIIIRAKHNRSYELSHYGTTILDNKVALGSGINVVTILSIRVDIANMNKFPIYYKITMNHGEVTGFSDDDTVPREVGKISSGKLAFREAVQCVTQPTEVYLLPGRSYFAEVDCSVNYGRSPKKLDKTFTWHKKVRFYLCPITAEVCDLAYADMDAVGRAISFE